eukprot:5773957-Pyramimonas_sp.AAC.1
MAAGLAPPSGEAAPVCSAGRRNGLFGAQAGAAPGHACWMAAALVQDRAGAPGTRGAQTLS